MTSMTFSARLLVGALALGAPLCLHAQSAGVLNCNGSAKSDINSLAVSYFNVSAFPSDVKGSKGADGAVTVDDTNLENFGLYLSDIQSRVTYGTCTLTQGNLTFTFSSVSVASVSSVSGTETVTTGSSGAGAGKPNEQGTSYTRIVLKYASIDASVAFNLGTK